MARFTLKEKIARLDHLKTVIAKVPDAKWTMNVIMISEFECGSRGCALGWAGMDPVFNKKGLKLKIKGRQQGFHLNGEYMGDPGYHTGYAVAAKFFGLTIPQTRELFFNWSNGTKEERYEVIEYIKKNLPSKSKKFSRAVR